MINMTSTITYMLREIGVPPHILGHDVLIDAIKLCFEDRKVLHNMTNVLYPVLANVHSTTKHNIEREIRHAVTYAFDNGDPDVLHSVFGNTVSPKSGKVTNQHFIAAIVVILQNEPNHPILKDCLYKTGEVV